MAPSDRGCSVKRRRSIKTGTARGPVPVTLRQAVPALPASYPAFLEDLKARVRAAQVRAALAVNRELIQLYWEIGAAIVERQRTEGWGMRVIDRLAVDLMQAFPGMAGFSRTNIYRMRAFHLAYRPKADATQLVARRPRGAIVPQAVGQSGRAVLPAPMAEIPWGHNVVLLEKLEDPATRLWYAQQTLAHGWSRAMLVHWIESRLHCRQGKAITNFAATLPPPQSDLAQQALKDPYVFDFLTVGPEAHEREVEQDLLAHLARFLLELGAGFALVGRQYHLEVSSRDYFLDLLFYHVRLHCFVVLELKNGPFEPEHAGKMNFYLSAVDDQLRGPGDNPTLGLILCRDRDRITVEYALRDVHKPIGVAGWQTRLTAALPKHLRNSLPTVAELEAELRRVRGQDNRA